MAAILDKYAIKEVADVMFYELDSKGAPSAPVLYLDTLKVSTINQSSETVDARGGKSNVKLLSWDTNKELTLELEDALFSARSLQMMFGGVMTSKEGTQEVLKTLPYNSFENIDGNTAYSAITINNQKVYIAHNLVAWFKYEVDATTGETKVVGIPSAATKPAKADFGTFDLLDTVKDYTAGTAVGVSGLTINITDAFDSNTYYITGDTYARNFQSGQDEFLQFIIPKGKVSAEDVSITMEADGDPATFSMTVQCLKSADNSMVKFIKYSLGEAQEGDAIKNKGAASVLDVYNDDTNKRAAWDNPNAKIAGLSKNDNTSVPDNE